VNGVVKAIVVAAVVAVAAFRIWRRRRARSRAQTARPPRPLFAPVFGDVGLVAAREVQARMRGKIFRIGTVLILAGVAAGIVIPVLHKGKHPVRVGVVGVLSAPMKEAVLASATQLHTTVRLIAEPNAAAASTDLRSGRIGFAIVDGRELAVKKPIASTDASTRAQLVRAVAETIGVQKAFASAGLSSAQAKQLAHAKPLPVASLEPGSISNTTAAVSTIGLILLFVMLTQYNAWTLMGVMEEKTSRVAEVLLATVRPVRLLTGKVLGIAVTVFAQAGLIVAFALVLAKAVGSDVLHGAGPRLIVSTLVWLVLGYAFYCWLYAAAGSMSTRQDQVQALALPLSLPILFGYVIALTTVASGSPSRLFDVLAYLPPTAPFAMPVLVSLGRATWWEFAASAAISVVCTVGVAMLATVVYRRAILRIGRRVRLRELVSRTAR